MVPIRQGEDSLTLASEEGAGISGEKEERPPESDLGLFPPSS